MRTIAVFLSICVLAMYTYAGQISEIELDDGSIIKGEVVGYGGGFYQIQTQSFGKINVRETEIRSIRKPGIAGKKIGMPTDSVPQYYEMPQSQRKVIRRGEQGAYESGQYSVPLPEQSDESKGFWASKIDSMKNAMMGNVEIMTMIMDMANDPDFQEVINDPEIRDALMRYDIKALMNNPRFMKLMNNQKVLEIKDKFMGGAE